MVKRRIGRGRTGLTGVMGLQSMEAGFQQGFDWKAGLLRSSIASGGWLMASGLSATLIVLAVLSPARAESATGKKPPGKAATSGTTVGAFYGPKVTVVLSRATPAQVAAALSEAAGVPVRFDSSVKLSALPSSLNVVTHETPLFVLAQQIGTALGLTPRFSSQGVTFVSLPVVPGPAPDVTQKISGFAGQGMPRELKGPLVDEGATESSLPGISAPGSTGGGMAGGGGAFPPEGNTLSLHPWLLAPRSRSIMRVPENSGEMPGNSLESASTQNASVASGSPGVLPPTEALLGYVMAYAGPGGAGMPSPLRMFPGLQTAQGSLRYVAVVTEALCRIHPAAGGDPVGRIRSLLGEAETLQQASSERDRLSTEILLLTQNLPTADPAVQPLLRSVLEKRQRELANLGQK